MDIRKRVITRCAQPVANTEEINFDLECLIQRLLLFDVVILKSIRLKEFSHIVSAFGYEGTVDLLSSGSLKIYCYALAIGQTGQLTVLKSRETKGALPLGAYSFSVVTPAEYKQYLTDCLKCIHNISGLSKKQAIKLKRAIVNSIVEVPDNPGTRSLEQLKLDIERNSPIIKKATIQSLKDLHGITAKEADFKLQMHRVGDADFLSETNIPNVFQLDQIANHRLIERSLLGVGGLNIRIDEMKSYQALSGCLAQDLPMLEEKLDFLARTISPQAQETRMGRILEIKGFPSGFVKGKNRFIDVNQLLKVRESTECKEFREWLYTIDSLSDKYLSEKLKGIRAKVGVKLTSFGGRLVRFLACTGISFIPVVGTAVGVGIGAIDTFIIEKLFPSSGIITFIDKLYPSIYKEGK